ncbi:MAG: ribosome biogenesis GTPase Der [Planctomycetota bacterium]|nr:ribosome biogenesis GTPase Der [Planctomycetota bacterium]
MCDQGIGHIRRRPRIAIVGRPNVGKSTLFNALLGRRAAITDREAGTTRDRILHPVRLAGRLCDLVDTGGIGIVDDPDIAKAVEAQIEAACETADVLIFVLDALDGLTPADREIATRLRGYSKPVVAAVNKTEGREGSLAAAEFSALGFDPTISISAAHRRGLEELAWEVAARLPGAAGGGAPTGGTAGNRQTAEDHPVCGYGAAAGTVEDAGADESGADDPWAGIPKIAIVGRRNVGKSSFVNALAGENRQIVSEKPGTTRDSVDVEIERDGRHFVIVDTAGMRRRSEARSAAEFFSRLRSEEAMRRADVIMLMFDAPEGITSLDRRIAAMAIETFRPVVKVVNKWDLAGKASRREYEAALDEAMPNMIEAPTEFVSALEGRRVWAAVDLALSLYRKSGTRIPTPVLNRAITEAERRHEPPARKGRKPRLLYGVQTGVHPPTFAIFCNHHDAIDDVYERYLRRQLAGSLGLEHVPIRIVFKPKQRGSGAQGGP